MANGNHEIERKYLLNGLPPHARTVPALDIIQGYLPGVRITERLRRTVSGGSARYYRTIKSGVGIDKLEVEEEIDRTFFETVWPLTRGHRVEKRRYAVPEGDVVWEVDEFVDRSGLWLAEVELKSVSQRVVVPEWLAGYVAREVTDDGAYTNAALAK